MQHQQHQRTQHQQHYRSHHGSGSLPGNVQSQRSEFLWRERVRLELHLHELLARNECLTQQWGQLEERKMAFGKQTPKVVGQIILSGLVGMCQLPSERMYQHEKERIAQEAYRIHQDMLACNSEIVALQTQIQQVDFELSLL